MADLKPFTDWLSHLRQQRLPLDTPPPAEHQNYFEWYQNTRGVNAITKERALKNYGDWLVERHKLGLPLEAPPPPGYESYNEWYRRMRCLDPRTGKAITPLDDPLIVGTGTRPRSGDGVRIKIDDGSPLEEEGPGTRSPSSARGAAPSSFLRRALLAAGNIANRLAAVGGGVRNALPVMGAVSTVIHAVREGKDAQSAPAALDLWAEASPGVRARSKMASVATARFG